MARGECLNNPSADAVFVRCAHCGILLHCTACDHHVDMFTSVNGASVVCGECRLAQLPKVSVEELLR